MVHVQCNEIHQTKNAEAAASHVVTVQHRKSKRQVVNQGPNKPSTMTTTTTKTTTTTTDTTTSTITYAKHINESTNHAPSGLFRGGLQHNNEHEQAVLCWF